MRVTRDALIAWGEALGRTLQPPAVIAVAGDVGAGKTTLSQAICRGFGVTDLVTSPTFTLVQEYVAGPPHSGARVYHLDLYRIDGDALGPLDWDAIVESDALVLVEWPERAGGRLPRDHMAVRLALAPSPPGAADLREPGRRMILGVGDAPVLALDASTYRGSVAVIRGTRVVADAATAMRGTSESERGERLMPAVAAVLDRAHVRVADLGAVVCGSGPGSFTSLRIAAAIAKGIADGADVPNRAPFRRCCSSSPDANPWPTAGISHRSTRCAASASAP